MGSIKNVVSEPIEGHEDYHMMVSTVSSDILTNYLMQMQSFKTGSGVRAGTPASPSGRGDADVVCCHSDEFWVACSVSATLWEPGLVPHKHRVLSVIAHLLSCDSGKYSRYGS